MLTLENLILCQGSCRLSANWNIQPGARVAVIGPSGAGKSTLLAGISGFLAPQSGHVLWQGRDITDDRPALRPIAMLFQDANLFPHLSVARNVAMGLRADQRLDQAQWNLVESALDRVGLTGLSDRRPGTLSGGQQSRAALARVLVQQRPLLLLDEPFAALGPALRDEMLDLVAGLCDETGATLLMVTHDPKDALRIAKQVIVVDGGRAEAPGEARQVLDNPTPGLRDYLGRGALD